MSMSNTNTSYGSVTKTFHWVTALLILSLIPLGIIANNLAYAIKDPAIATTDADLTRTAFLFSLHKTLGVAVFFVAVLRILWGLSQPKPGLLNGDKPAEAWAAETVHWLLYGSLVMVPLSGWVHHAATTGFAPIWWPFGQSLPFVPKSETLAHQTATLHYILQWVLVGAVGLHIAGALKHHVIDKDATLRRMLPGRVSAEPASKQPGHTAPFVMALAIWALALVGGGMLGWFKPHSDAPEPVVAEADSRETLGEDATASTSAPETSKANDSWSVESGTLSIAVTQLGSKIAGSFAEWSADIIYSTEPDSSGIHGSVEVLIDITSLTLGSVTTQAMGTDFLNSAQHPTARFVASIEQVDELHIAKGALTIKGVEVPVQLPFDLGITDGTALAKGTLKIDRRDFGVGAADEGNVGAEVVIEFDLIANAN